MSFNIIQKQHQKTGQQDQKYDIQEMCWEPQFFQIFIFNPFRDDEKSDE
jgi:hypothetical protein